MNTQIIATFFVLGLGFYHIAAFIAAYMRKGLYVMTSYMRKGQCVMAA